MLICPSCHSTVNDAEAWMMCPACGFAFEDDDAQPTSPQREAIREVDPSLVYPSEMSEEDLEPDQVEIAVHTRPGSVRELPSRKETPLPKPAPRELTIDPRAKRLLEAAEHDRAKGDLASALTNLKLAVTFDPNSAELRQLLHEVARTAPAQPRAASRAMSQKPPSDKGSGDLDDAIGALKKSLATPKKKPPAPEPKRSGSVLGLFGKKK
jgi:hypothetical protein